MGASLLLVNVVFHPRETYLFAQELLGTRLSAGLELVGNARGGEGQ